MADLIFDCPECAHNLIVDAQAAGLVVGCPECGTQIRVPHPDQVPEPGEITELADREAAAPAAMVPTPEMSAAALEYRVVSLIDGAPEKITADAVEYKLNELLQEGWQLRSATTVQTCDAQGQPGQELLLILERRI